MPATRLTLANFRSFRESASLDLCPVTLVYGANNVGKSALIRALPLISDSLGGDRDALELTDRMVDSDLTFERLRWRGDRKESGEDIEVSLDFDDQTSVAWTIREPADWNRTVVSTMMFASPGRTATEEWRLRRGEERAAELTYETRQGETRHRFSGLLPPPDLFGLDWEPLRRCLEDLRNGVIWLTSMRPPPARRTQWKGGVKWSLDPRGQDAPIVLSEGIVRDDVVRWYREALGLNLDIREVAQRDALIEVQRLGGAPRVDLLDCGEGPGQVLPVVTALAMVKHHAERNGPSIVCIEEPESHLHPDAQASLADFVCECATADGVRIVMETHSPYFLYAVHLNVMRGLPESAVALHWVRQESDGESTVERCEMAADGTIRGNWPPDAFGTEFALLSEMERRRQGSA